MQIEIANATTSLTTKTLQNAWKYLFSLVSKDHIFSLADQAAVSCTSFLTTVLIARWSGSSELGIYAVGVSLLLSFAALQDSLISQPYAVQRHYREGTPADGAGASLILNLLFSAASMFVMIIAAVALWEWGSSPELIVMTWVIAAIVPFALTRDFARRLLFAHLEIHRAFFLDLSVATIQLSALIWLGVSGRLSAMSAFAVLGTACALPTAFWLYYTRKEFRIYLRHVQIVLKQTWALGKWLLAGRAPVQTQAYIISWLSIAIAGATVTGTYAACMSIVGFVNPLLTGLANVLIPKSALAWKNGGGPELWREAIRNTVLIGTLMAGFNLAVVMAGEHIMLLLYHGPEYEGLGHTLNVLALGMSVGALGTPASAALATMERPRMIVVAATIGAVVTVILVWFLMKQWGLLGAAYGLLGGSVIGVLGRWVAFYSKIPKARDSTAVIRVLEDFTKATGESRWSITRIGDGSQAEIFIVKSTGEPIRPVFQGLVIKIYKHEAGLAVETVQAQFEALSSLHAALDGVHINDWKILVPRPLYVCKAPLALVMTAVPGEPIEACVAQGSNGLPLPVLLDAAGATATAMQTCWSYGQRHGDFGMQNLLFDVKTKEVSLIDAGTVDSCRICNGGFRENAAAADLAHLLCSVTTDVTDLVNSQSTRVIKELFAENALLAIIENADAEQKRRLLDEIWHCFQEHLPEWLQQSWSPKGVVHRFAAQIARSRVRSILTRVNSHPKSWARNDRTIGRAVQSRSVQARTI